jgi:hypothetical protein
MSKSARAIAQARPWAIYRVPSHELAIWSSVGGDRRVCRPPDRRSPWRLTPPRRATCTDRLNETVFVPQATDRHTIESSSWRKTDRHVRCSTDRRWPASVTTVSLICKRQTLMQGVCRSVVPASDAQAPKTLTRVWRQTLHSSV